MKNVLIPFAYRRSSPDAIGPKHFVRETYIKKLQKYNLLPIFVSSAMKADIIAKKFRRADGLLLMGGLDMQTHHYTDQPAHEANDPSPVRDDLELQLVRRAYEQAMPILGICRGAQVMAVAAGGSLYQHLPDQPITETHGDSVDGEGYDHVVEIEHPIHIKADTQLQHILKTDTITVNSGHHQAIKEPGEPLDIAAVTDQGVIEAVEHTRDDYFAVGLQSHPEAEEDGPLEPVFAAFRRAVGSGDE